MIVERQLEVSRLQALDTVETYGLTADIETMGTMLRVVDIGLVGSEEINAGLVAVMVQGDVGAVKTATEVGAGTTSRVGECVSVHVTPRPHGSVGVILPQTKQGGG